MTREQTIEAIRIMQAWVDGKEVECQYHGSETPSNAPNRVGIGLIAPTASNPPQRSDRGLRMRFRWECRLGMPNTPKHVG